MKRCTFLLVFLFCLTSMTTNTANAAIDFDMSGSAAEATFDDTVNTDSEKNKVTFTTPTTGDTTAAAAEAPTDTTTSTDVTTETKPAESEDKTTSGSLTGKGYVKSTGWLNLREKPSKSSRRLAKLYFNDEVNIVATIGGWYQIDSPQSGYVMAEFISSTPLTDSDNKGAAKLSNGKGYVNCDGWLNLREKPTKKSARLAKLYKNDEVNIIARNGDWYQIDSPKSGWVMAEFISASKTGSSSSESTSSSEVTSENPGQEGTQVTGPMSTEPMGGSESSTYNPGTKGNGTTTINTLGEKWTVVKTPIGVVEYAKFLKSNQVCQNKDTSKYGSACLSFAYTHAWGLYCGNRGVSAEKRSGGGNFKTLIDDNKQYILNAVYLEIMAGRPCILHVNGNKQGTGRHFVTCIGFKSSVQGGDTITEDDLLILDSWDAQIERMDQKNSRFMTTGKQCRKSYSGHRIQYMK